jgi:hypothetical protein
VHAARSAGCASRCPLQLRNAAAVEADPLLDAPVVANYSGVSEFTLRQMIERGDLPAVNLRGNVGAVHCLL